MEKKDYLLELLIKGAREGVYPGAVLLVSHKGEIVFFKEVGYSSLIPHPISMNKDTIFDLASLTKPLATTLTIMKLVDEGKVYLDQPLESLLSKPIPRDKCRLTPRLLLSHCAGLADWKPFYLELERFRPEKRKGLIRERILEMPLVYSPGEGTLYSDLGFMILEWVIEENAGISLDRFLDRHFYGPLSLEKTFLSSVSCPLRFKGEQFAATEDCPWRKKLVLGCVHDENAFVLGGYSGHAGLFGIAEEVYILVNFLREHFYGMRNDYFKPETVRTFFTRQDIVNGSTFALGWDTPSPQDSSSGKHFSENSVGHLGFTGTSIWMDLDRDVIVVFLSNRIHPTRDNDKIKVFRPRLHDLIMA